MDKVELVTTKYLENDLVKGVHIQCTPTEGDNISIYARTGNKSNHVADFIYNWEGGDTDYYKMYQIAHQAAVNFAKANGLTTDDVDNRLAGVYVYYLLHFEGKDDRFLLLSQLETVKKAIVKFMTDDYQSELSEWEKENVSSFDFERALELRTDIGFNCEALEPPFWFDVYVIQVGVTYPAGRKLEWR